MVSFRDNVRTLNLTISILSDSIISQLPLGRISYIKLGNVLHQILHLMHFLKSQWTFGNIEISMYVTLLNVQFNNISCLSLLEESEPSASVEQFNCNSDSLVRNEM